MNPELLKKIQETIEEKEKLSVERKNDYEKDKDHLTESERKARIEQQQALVDSINALRAERNNYIAVCQAYENSRSNDDYTRMVILNYELMKKYGVVEKEEPIEVNSTRKSKKGLGKRVAAWAGAILLLAAMGLGLRGCNKKDTSVRAMLANAYVDTNVPKPSETPIDELIEETPAPTEEPVPTETPVPTATPTPTPEPTPAPTDEVEAAIEEVVEELPFETYGQFTDAYNQDQVDARAQWYFDTYLKNLCYNGITFKEVNAEKLGRVLTMINGEFVRREDGSIDYNKTYRQDVGNTICSIWNFASFQQMGDQIQFVPMAPLFEDGSLAQEAALKMDSIMLRVVNAIRSGNHDEFRAAAEDFGTAMLNMCVYIDFNGQYVNMYHTDASHGYSALIGWYAQYISTIFEYSQKYNINICFDYCYNNNTEEVDKMSLSELFDMLVNGVIPDHVAARAGTLAQYIEAHRGHSLYRDFADRYEIYFEDKFDKEPSGFVPRLTPEQ